MFHSYRNQSIDLQCKSINWFLYKENISMEKFKHTLIFEVFTGCFSVWNPSLSFKIRVWNTLFFSKVEACEWEKDGKDNSQKRFGNVKKSHLAKATLENLWGVFALWEEPSTKWCFLADKLVCSELPRKCPTWNPLLEKVRAVDCLAETFLKHRYTSHIFVKHSFKAASFWNTFRKNLRWNLFTSACILYACNLTRINLKMFENVPENFRKELLFRVSSFVLDN